MTVSNVTPRVQYTATSSQTEFTVPFEFTENTDLAVYQRTAGSDPDDSADILTYLTEYTVTGAGDDAGGTVTLVTGATSGDIITIERAMDVDRTTAFTAMGILKAENFNDEYDHQTLIESQLEMISDKRTPRYPASATINARDLVLPILGADQVWSMNAAGTAIEAVTYDSSTSAAALEAELESHTAGEGASKIGLEDQGSVSDKTVQDFNEAAFIAQTDNGTLPNAQFLAALTTGMVRNTTTTGVLSIDAPMTAFSDLSFSADKLPYATGASTFALTDLTSFARTLLDDANAATAAATLAVLPTAGGTMSGNINMGTNKITNAAAPTAGSDYTTKNYVDNIIVNTHPAADLATTANFAYTYDNGTSGVGATLTAGGNGVVTIDGTNVSLNDRVLFKNQTNGFENGVYDCTTEGTAGATAVFTRATDYDEASDMEAGDKFAVVGGTANATTEWMMTQTSAITVGTTDITFAEMAQAGALLQSNNLSDVDSASTSRTNLGLDTMATQAANNVAITGGAIDGTTIGGTTPAAGTFTSVTVQDEIIHDGDADNKIVWGTDTQDYQTGGASRLDMNDSGVRLGGANARITTILTDTTMAAASDTNIYTGLAVKTYVDTNVADLASQNIIIGGNFSTNPWQRGTTFTSVADGTYTADRFEWIQSGAGVVDIKKTADAPTVAESGVYSAECLHVDVTTADATIAAGDYYAVRYQVEGFDISESGFGQTGTRNVTISFWHKHTKTGIYCASLGNSAADRSYVQEYTQTTTDTWEKSTLTFPVDTTGTWLYTNGTGLSIYFPLAIGSDRQGTGDQWNAANDLATANQVNALDANTNNFKLDLIKLEQGDVATPYPIESRENIVARCQRYFNKSYMIGVAPGTSTFAGRLMTNAAGTAVGRVTCPLRFPVSMRDAPTVTLYAPDGTSGQWLRGDAAANVAMVTGNISTEYTHVENNAVVTDGEQLSGHYAADAEL